MSIKRILFGCISVFFLMLLHSCYYPTEDYSDEWDMTDIKLDSLSFEERHHYTVNFNFQTVVDTLFVYTGSQYKNYSESMFEDSLAILNGERIVVADIMIIPSDTVDSVWVKVARDQYTMGWVREKSLLKQVVPDDPISLFIHIFSNKHLIYFLSAIGVFIITYVLRRIRKKSYSMVHFDDISSCYPTLLCITISGAAVLYVSIQKFVPQTWQEFYFHPTLNPFNLPFILSLFISSVWLMVIFGIAVIDDVRKLLSPYERLVYLLTLACVCAGCYLFFSFTTYYYIGYVVLLVYVIWAIYRYYTRCMCVYICGACGKRMSKKGKCPHCGAINE